MVDDLEKYVMDHRSEFDVEEPRVELWFKVKSKLDRDRKKPLQYFWKVAAMLFFVSTVYLSVQQTIQKKELTVSVDDQFSDFVQVEEYYYHLISQKKAEFSSYDHLNLRKSVFVELDRLDQQYLDLKNIYTTQNASDVVIEAMVQNLRLRINILEQQVKLLKELNKSKNEKEVNTAI